MESAAPRPFAGGAPEYAAPNPHQHEFDADAAPPHAADEETMWEPISRAMTAFKRIASSYALLAVLDMRRAAVQLAWLVGAGIVVTVLCVTAWLAAVVGLAVWLLGQGMSWPAVLFIAAALNIVAAGLVLWRMRHVFEAAPFAATLRQLNVEPGEKKEKGDAT